MVIWVFSGGGEAEIGLRSKDKKDEGGLIKFLQKNFPGCTFVRKTPARIKPGPKPGKSVGYGKTGKSLIAQINQELPIALKNEPNKCDLILVFDDLDCRNPILQREKFLAAISEIPNTDEIPKFVGFAAPEIESWIIADWDNTIAKSSDFRGRHEKMRWWLSTQKDIPFDAPESFSEYDDDNPKRDCCKEKLSEALVKSSILAEFGSVTRFSKGYHTPLLLLEIQPDEVQRKCPLFRELYHYLFNFRSSQENKSRT
ncbi:DUF4276 family protein [Sphaerospermopsis torques-reginae]|uniref:DUF4276 family protein n=1 Tax=Sphaerospermopsis torques-reginae TaxID=984207 RepID=UPI001FEC30AF|nr:DUF4276 family protein [Sphaerospermopsis torques-reginae]